MGETRERGSGREEEVEEPDEYRDDHTSADHRAFGERGSAMTRIQKGIGWLVILAVLALFWVGVISGVISMVGR